MQIEGVTGPAVAGRQHHRRAVDEHAKVADQAGIQHRVELGPVTTAAFPQAVQPGAVGPGQGCVSAHDALPYKLSGLARIATLGLKEMTTCPVPLSSSRLPLTAAAARFPGRSPASSGRGSPTVGWALASGCRPAACLPSRLASAAP